jgi:hypothetical protein
MVLPLKLYNHAQRRIGVGSATFAAQLRSTVEEAANPQALPRAAGGG